VKCKIIFAENANGDTAIRRHFLSVMFTSYTKEIQTDIPERCPKLHKRYGAGNWNKGAAEFELI
jgi:hypothetical protein